MTLAQFLGAVRARAHTFPQPPPAARLESALTTLTGLGALPGGEGKALRRLLAALAQSQTEPNFDGHELEALGPLAISALDCLVDAMLSGALPDTQLRDALRPYLVRLAN